MEGLINEEELDREANRYAEEHTTVYAMRAVMVEVYKTAYRNGYEKRCKEATE